MVLKGDEGFFAARWRGKAPVTLLFWRDMIAVGSVINLAATVIAMIVAANGATTAAVALHFAPVPYNAFLFLSIWRMRADSPAYGVAALAWLIVATLI